MAAITRRTTRTFGVGLVMLGVLGFLLYLALGAQLQSNLPWQTTTELEAEFDDIATLSPGDDVRENGIHIGNVSEVRRENETVVKLQLDGEVPVFADARAVIADRSALASRYVELHRGHPDSGKLPSERIPLAQTASATDLGELVDVFDEQTREKLKGLVGELGGGVAGHSEDLHDVLDKAPRLLSGVSDVTSALSSPEADLGAVVNNVDELATQFQGRENDVSNLVTGLDKTLRSVNVDHGEPLTNTLDKLPSGLDTVRVGLNSMDAPLADTRDAVVNLRPGTGALGQAVPELRGFLREGTGPLGKVPGVAGAAVPAVQELSHTLADARPLIPKLSDGLAHAVAPLEVLAPYASDLVVLGQRGRSFASSTVNGEHVARIGVNVTPGSVLGPVGDPGFQRNVYPGPGEAKNNHADSLIRGAGE